MVKRSKKTQEAMDRRIADFKKSGEGHKGYYEPGSENPHKVRGK